MMKILFFTLITFPVFACKMTPESAKRRSEAAALEIVGRVNKSKELKVRKVKNHWIVRSVKPSCIEYRVKLFPIKGDCKMDGRILSQKPCS